MKRSTLIVAAFLLASGMCALVYQPVWFRMFRVVFGTSTAATSAVLAIFMGSLGYGAIRLGRRAHAHANPLQLYARLEIGIALAAAASLVLIQLTNGVYVGLGGSATLGELGATILHCLRGT